MGLLLSVFFWTYAIFQLPAGYIIDRFGIRLVYAIAFTLWSLASASIALSHTPRRHRRFQARTRLCGIRRTISQPDFHPSLLSSPRGAAFPQLSTLEARPLVPPSAPSSASLVLASFGWRILFAVTGLGALIWVPLWLLFAPKQTPPGDMPAKSIPITSFFDRPSVWLLSGVVFFSSYFWWFVMTWMPGYMTLARSFSTASMGRTLSIPLFTMVLTNLIAGWVSDRLVAKSGNPLRIRAIVGSIGLLAASTLLLLNFQHIPVLPVLLVCICGFGMASASMWTIAQTMVSSAVVARFIGFLNTLSQIAGVAAPLITGFTVGSHNNFHFAIWMAGVSPLIAAACLMAIQSSAAGDT